LNLKELLEQEGTLSPRDAIELGLQVARGLAFAHEQGLVHRDVKPQNVIIDAEGRAKVTDFGIARSLDVDGMTITGTIMGTSNYIAPEQARGQAVDEQTDVYSLGCVLYELLAGEGALRRRQLRRGRDAACERAGPERPRDSARRAASARLGSPAGHGEGFP